MKWLRGAFHSARPPRRILEISILVAIFPGTLTRHCMRPKRKEKEQPLKESGFTAGPLMRSLMPSLNFICGNDQGSIKETEKKNPDGKFRHPLHSPQHDLWQNWISLRGAIPLERYTHSARLATALNPAHFMYCQHITAAEGDIEGACCLCRKRNNERPTCAGGTTWAGRKASRNHVRREGLKNRHGDGNPRRRPLDQHTLILASFTSEG
ncbi:hypothetical protein ASPZODRAFT_319185 [Penicilliopsis zonata CBS 506.65]|uniref:Uncharacterized protein n=1 Tax=Penicilliopsis zonata CBS 506.65 TaxID=1073090 RepID=A0A1L9SV62_9EURO|nr:hypothetical protein ASPZODRAFT_319185 [Penicilliopsis zonata CBS 506.65]OJJ51105.1 hypothetical protein ASPZODRAFT_319185 [Penicilliopsis zonata CBS 506.65]